MVRSVGQPTVNPSSQHVSANLTGMFIKFPVLAPRAPFPRPSPLPYSPGISLNFPPSFLARITPNPLLLAASATTPHANPPDALGAPPEYPSRLLRLGFVAEAIDSSFLPSFTLANPIGKIAARAPKTQCQINTSKRRRRVQKERKLEQKRVAALAQDSSASTGSTGDVPRREVLGHAAMVVNEVMARGILDGARELQETKEEEESSRKWEEEAAKKGEAPWAEPRVEKIAERASRDRRGGAGRGGGQARRRDPPTAFVLSPKTPDLTGAFDLGPNPSFPAWFLSSKPRLQSLADLVHSFHLQRYESGVPLKLDYLVSAFAAKFEGAPLVDGQAPILHHFLHGLVVPTAQKYGVGYSLHQCVPSHGHSLDARDDHGNYLDTGPTARIYRSLVLWLTKQNPFVQIKNGDGFCGCGGGFLKQLYRHIHGAEPTKTCFPDQWMVQLPSLLLQYLELCIEALGIPLLYVQPCGSLASAAFALRTIQVANSINDELFVVDIGAQASTSSSLFPPLTNYPPSIFRSNERTHIVPLFPTKHLTLYPRGFIEPRSVGYGRLAYQIATISCNCDLAQKTTMLLPTEELIRSAYESFANSGVATLLEWDALVTLVGWDQVTVGDLWTKFVEGGGSDTVEKEGVRRVFQSKRRLARELDVQHQASRLANTRYSTFTAYDSGRSFGITSQILVDREKIRLAGGVVNGSFSPNELKNLQSLAHDGSSRYRGGAAPGIDEGRWSRGRSIAERSNLQILENAAEATRLTALARSKDRTLPHQVRTTPLLLNYSSPAALARQKRYSSYLALCSRQLIAKINELSLDRFQQLLPVLRAFSRDSLTRAELWTLRDKFLRWRGWPRSLPYLHSKKQRWQRLTREQLMILCEDVETGTCYLAAIRS